MSSQSTILDEYHSGVAVVFGVVIRSTADREVFTPVVQSTKASEASTHLPILLLSTVV